MKKAQILSEIMSSKSLNPNKLSSICGVPSTTIRSIFINGVDKASFDNIAKICRGLGITPDLLEKMADADIKNALSDFEERATEKVSPEQIQRDFYEILENTGIGSKKLSRKQIDLITKLIKAVVESDL